ncbi:uncharacterized protein LOC112058626 isoform X2 [Bicyclus anynana]|uniref:Uncharacterized protein LOC112058626 isoform X2 n=1 Tax=Bicyclus anynana TaxID=110368 RepID=A0ABM3LIK6_BICAN|nr:uncharacterized protein LOC112058626 isoform X2 [Bicyclus anynana]
MLALSNLWIIFAVNIHMFVQVSSENKYKNFQCVNFKMFDTSSVNVKLKNVPGYIMNSELYLYYFASRTSRLLANQTFSKGRDVEFEVVSYTPPSECILYVKLHLSNRIVKQQLIRYYKDGKAARHPCMSHCILEFDDWTGIQNKTTLTTSDRHNEFKPKDQCMAPPPKNVSSYEIVQSLQHINYRHLDNVTIDAVIVKNIPPNNEVSLKWGNGNVIAKSKQYTECWHTFDRLNYTFRNEYNNSILNIELSPSSTMFEPPPFKLIPIALFNSVYESSANYRFSTVRKIIKKHNLKIHSRKRNNKKKEKKKITLKQPSYKKHPCLDKCIILIDIAYEMHKMNSTKSAVYSKERLLDNNNDLFETDDIEPIEMCPKDETLNFTQEIDDSKHNEINNYHKSYTTTTTTTAATTTTTVRISSTTISSTTLISKTTSILKTSTESKVLESMKTSTEVTSAMQTYTEVTPPDGGQLNTILPIVAAIFALLILIVAIVWYRRYKKAKAVNANAYCYISPLNYAQLDLQSSDIYSVPKKDYVSVYTRIVGVLKSK